MKAIGYIRVSTEEQAKGGISLEHQREKVRAYCELHEMELTDVVADEGMSAKTISTRPGALKVLQAAAEGSIDAVVVYKLDRLFRNAQEALEVAEELNRQGVALHSVTESIDTHSAIGKFFFTIMAACAEMERNLVAERTRDAIRHKKANGKIYNHVPYGYRREGDMLVPDMIEQGRIKKMCRLHQQGYNYAEIARIFNEEGIPAKKGGRWYAQTVKNILTSGGIDAGI